MMQPTQFLARGGQGAAGYTALAERGASPWRRRAAAAAGGQLPDPCQGSGAPRLHRGFIPSASQTDAAELGISLAS